MARCLFSLLPSSEELELSIYFIQDDVHAPTLGVGVQDCLKLSREQKALLEVFAKGLFPKEGKLEKLKIPSKIADEFFQKAASLGMLSFQGKKVFFDPFVCWDLEVEVLEEERHLLVEIYFKLGSLKVPFKEITWSHFDKKGWVLYRDTLRGLNPDYDPKFIRELFKRKEWLKEQKSLFLTQDECAPQITCLFDEAKEYSRSLVLLDLYGMELLANSPIPKELQSELQEAGYQKKREDLFTTTSDKAKEGLELLVLGGWTLQDAKGRKIVPLSHCDVRCDDSEGDVFEIESDLYFGEVKKKWRELTFEGTMLVSLSKDSLGLILPKQLPPYLRDPKFRLKPHIPIKVDRAHFGELEGISLPEVFQKLLSDRDEKSALPSDLFSGALFPYQQKGLSWLFSLRSCGFSGLLADEMGLGKTVQVIAFLSHLENLPALIAVPASLVVQWKKEIEKFLPGASVFIYNSEEGLKAMPCEDRTHKSICITSFGMIRKDADVFASKAWQALILDEAHAILNQKSLLFEAITRIKAPFRLAMTGTPLVNRQADFESLFSFLVPGLLEKALSPEKIRMRTSPLVLRRMQAEVFDELPEKIEEEVLTQLTEEQQECYEKLQEGIASLDLHEAMKHRRMEVLEVILRLRQVCLHPELAGFNSHEFDFEKSGKFSLLLLDLEEIIQGKKKAIVCSSFAKALRLLEKWLPFPKEKIAVLDGKTSDRQGVVEAFEKSEEGMVLLLSLKAGGVGLNLPSADSFFLLDPWWNEAMEEQAIYRALRLGRKKKLIVKKYISIGTLEEKMQLLKKSKKLEEKILLGDHFELNEEMLEDLLKT